MADLRILQIVGYKKSGKTSLISSWVEHLTDSGIRVAVIKHHGHHTPLEQPNDGTDSMRFYHAGAVSSIVVGSDTIQLHMCKEQFRLNNYIHLAMMSEPEVILIEGFKEADFPKVVLLREEADWDTLQHVTNCIAVIIPEGVSLSSIATIRSDDNARLNRLLLDWLDGE